MSLKRCLAKTALLLFFPAFASTAQGTTQAHLAALCDSLMAHFQSAADTPRLAVLPFAYDGDSSFYGPGRIIAEGVVAQLKKNKKIKLVDRMDFHNAVTEIIASGSTLIDQRTAISMGKLEAAQYLLTGSVGTALGEAKISAQIMEVETGKIVTVAVERADVLDLQQYARELVVEKAQVQSSIFRSTVLPGWGQIYTENYVRGSISLAVCLGALGYTIYMAQMTANANKKYHDYNDYLGTDAWRADMRRDTTSTHATWAEASKDFFYQDTLNYKDYSRKYDRMVLAGAVTIGVWALNIVDATLCGMESKNKFKLYFSGDMSGEVEAGVAWKF
jgi:TolB-like protein